MATKIEPGHHSHAHAHQPSTTPHNLGDALGKALMDGQYVDIIVRSSDDKDFSCHKVVLSARSVFLANALQDSDKQFTGDGVELLQMSDVSSSTLGIALEWIYKDKANYLDNLKYKNDSNHEMWFLHVVRVYALADRLGLPGLKVNAAAYLRSIPTLKSCIFMPEYRTALQIAYTALPATDYDLKDALIERVDAHAMARLKKDHMFRHWLAGVPALAVDLAFAVTRYTHYIEYRCTMCKNNFSTEIAAPHCANCGSKKKGTVLMVEDEDRAKPDHKVNGMVNGLKRGSSQISDAASGSSS